VILGSKMGPMLHKWKKGEELSIKGVTFIRKAKGEHLEFEWDGGGV